tara:strand:- start:3547 stop:4395 length:849 start_codon:yes stop_codon:yes gene_type:complete
MIKFSILVPTLNRSSELARMLDSIVRNNYDEIEILLVDQNDNDIIECIIEKYDLQIKHIKSHVKGLSVNRNIGIKSARNEWIVLADDDAVFGDNYFRALADHINQDPKIDIWVSNVRNIEDHAFYTHPPTFRPNNFKIHHFKQVCSISLAIKNTVFEEIGMFDEEFGVGAKFGACEESDIVLRAFFHQFHFGRSNQCNIYHPQIKKNFTNLERVKSYSLGFGALHKKYIRIRPWREKAFFLYSFLNLLLRSSIGLVLNSFSNKRKYFYASLIYKIKGFFQYK